MHDEQSDMRRDFAAIAGDETVAELMASLCDVAGLGFVVIAEVTEESWRACAVLDRIQMGVVAGQCMDVSRTFCREVSRTRRAIVMDHASADPRYCDDPLPKMYGFESYISVPIIMSNGEYLGNLCALDRQPAYISDPRIQLMFHCYARLIAEHVESRATRGSTRVAPLHEHIGGNLRGLFVALLAEALPDPALRQLAARVVAQTQGLSTLVNDVLAYARGRLNGGMPGYIWKVDDLHARLQAMVADTVAAHPTRTIITNIAFDQPVDCDPGLIQELASNLLQHALEHAAPAGPVSFIVSTHDNDLEIAVWNEGKVFSKNALRNVFTPALRPGSDPSAARQGLHTCAQIVRAHLGTIGVTSSATEGTQYVARIPVARSLRLH